MTDEERERAQALGRKIGILHSFLLLSGLLFADKLGIASFVQIFAIVSIVGSIAVLLTNEDKYPAAHSAAGIILHSTYTLYLVFIWSDASFLDPASPIYQLH